MTKMFSLTPAEMEATLFARDDLDGEHLEPGQSSARGRRRPRLSGAPRRLLCRADGTLWLGPRGARGNNVSPPSEVSDTFRARIAKDNQLDIELYEFARQLMAIREVAVDGR